MTNHDLEVFEAAMGNLIEFRCDPKLRHDFWLKLDGEFWHLYVGGGRASVHEMGTLIGGLWPGNVSDWVLACICEMIDHPAAGTFPKP